MERPAFDDELARALDGLHDSRFDVIAAKYRTLTAVERSIGASDAVAATVAARQARKAAEARFVSVQMNIKGNS
jgi:hypothetical protein